METLIKKPQKPWNYTDQLENDLNSEKSKMIEVARHNHCEESESYLKRKFRSKSVQKVKGGGLQECYEAENIAKSEKEKLVGEKMKMWPDKIRDQRKKQIEQIFMLHQNARGKKGSVLTTTTTKCKPDHEELPRDL